ncbi:MAG: hypothetical protein OXI94_08340 [Gemmatimonadota bacterium]|nr:hypothetical protein [Gemmatimonadota bacterium]
MLLLFRTLSGISLISGSFLGFSISWISHCRGIVRDIEYGAAEDLFFKLEKKQKELIYRWLVALLLAVIIGVSTVLISLTPGWKYILFILLAIAYGQILVLFLGMLSLGHLRTKLDDHERKELRKKRHTPPDIDSQEYKSLSKASP